MACMVKFFVVHATHSCVMRWKGFIVDMILGKNTEGKEHHLN